MERERTYIRPIDLSNGKNEAFDVRESRGRYAELESMEIERPFEYKGCGVKYRKPFNISEARISVIMNCPL